MFDTVREMLAVEPPRLLEYTWDGETLRFELAAVDTGWQDGLDQLASLLDTHALR